MFFSNSSYECFQTHDPERFPPIPLRRQSLPTKEAQRCQLICHSLHDQSAEFRGGNQTQPQQEPM